MGSQTPPTPTRLTSRTLALQEEAGKTSAAADIAEEDPLSYKE